MRTGKEFRNNVERDNKRREILEENEDQLWLNQNTKKSLLDLTSQDVESASISKPVMQEDVFEEDSKKLSTIQKVLLLNELGIIDFIKERYSQFNDTEIAKILSLVAEDKHDTIRRCIIDINSGRDNDPYRVERNQICINAKLSNITKGLYSTIKVKGEK